MQKLLKEWKIENNITAEICDVHHRNDTEECHKYNEEHYELWGHEIDENGNIKFELGKYVQFMTHGEHSRYHQLNKPDAEREKRSNAVKGSNNPFFGKRHSDIARQKMSATRKGKSFTNGHRKSMSENMQARAKLYEKYKSCGGTLVWNDFRRALANNEIDIDLL